MFHFQGNGPGSVNVPRIVPGLWGSVDLYRILDRKPELKNPLLLHPWMRPGPKRGKEKRNS